MIPLQMKMASINAMKGGGKFTAITTTRTKEESKDARIQARDADTAVTTT